MLPGGRARRCEPSHGRRPWTGAASAVPTVRLVTAPIPIVLDCDPGHDDAIALLLALGSPEVEVIGVTTTYGNQTLEKTTANALRVLELVGRTDVQVAAGTDRPLKRDLVVAAHVHGESGLDGPALPPAATEAVPTDATAFIAECVRGAVTDV
ncbi:MAG: nucleoside hydrolase, partial [Actinobacteria bacterium]|nr:nucleoside hydrolase [Actinomycetota bacterium]